MRLSVAAPGLDLDLVVRSHGWYDLPPFAWDEEARRLSFVFLHGGSPCAVAATERDGGVAVRAGAGVPAAAVRRVVRRVLDLDAELPAFHALCAAREAEGFGWIARRGAGRRGSGRRPAGPARRER